MHLELLTEASLVELVKDFQIFLMKEQEMSKKIMLNLVIILTGLIFLVNGQESNIPIDDTKLPIKLTISVDETICVGKPISIVSRLENISKENITINIRKINQIRHEMAYARQPDTFLSGLRSSFTNIYDLDSPPKSFLLCLAPGESYEYKSFIDPKKDDFYKFAGKYNVQIVNMQPDAEKLEGTGLFFGKLFSNKLEFDIKDCS